ncbi:MAG: APC family permease [Longimicrobiales bacterium]|nr:APC family permease [Longimicrobiales bacterium]
MNDPAASGRAILRREVGLPGAVLLGLGSMVGTGVFVSVAIAAGVAGPAVLTATALAALLAAANGLSSAQLAAAHPVSGGSYEYGYRLLTPVLGFSAGWMFLLAKSASAATAALGLSGYLLDWFGVGHAALRTGTAAAAALAVTALVAGGIRRSNAGNALLVGLTLATLAALAVFALPVVLADGGARLTPLVPPVGEGGAGALLHGAALMFVAFTGYGRIATLGEEVRDPRHVIPRAIVVTMGVVSLLYLAVATAGVGVLGADAFAASARGTAAPLEAVARALEVPLLTGAVAVAAVAAMAGVLLNLVLGLSRVVLAMARRGDAPAALARVHAGRGSPVAAVWACGALVTAIALVGEVRATWSFSAFTVLVYYAITNLAALRLPAADRLFPRWIPAAGLVGCLALAFRVEPGYWLTGGGLLASGLAVRALARRTGHGG